ncbi:hypothetical protein A3B45_05195 [Candidatus Daviesbacteria bacterium RIFCSPLOWO2_01_FULL_39_12]|uniref:DUF2283 domain-containing protein n=1 Tax=Candidatus Daviesbacteria bacterium RIFCSPLOWO2_01_FULL_39_12 TaxID=1797785 RepID=A0A1F5KUD0_9BACT|nr:MAG: hypothetical protein A3B45_05195 [Candidatus Daviesbacteria bacterium RIFCSPLOWO2_01_FULL_39_12]
MKAKYYEDADLISWKISKKPFEYATRTGDFVVHYSRDNEPVLIEILNASKFLKVANSILPKKIRKQVLPQEVYPAVAHRISK